MDSFVEFYNRNTREVAEAVDQTEYELRENIGPLDALMPVQTYASRELLILKMKGDISVASIISPDQQLPNDQGEFSLNEDVLGNLLIGKQHVFTDKEYEMLEQMRTYLISGGPRGQAVVDAVEKYLYGMAADMPVAIDTKHLILMFQVLTTGACDYTDPLTELKVTLTYNDIVSALFPSTLTGNNRWSQPTTANGLANLEDLSEEWRSIHGVKPAWMLAHYTDLRNLANQTTTKNALGAKVGTDNTLASSLYIGTDYNRQTLELEPGPMLELIRERTGVERVLIVDKKYTETLKDGTKRKSSFLPTNYVVFGDSEGGSYERARVPFKENGWQSGIYVRTKELDDAPLRERIAGMTAGVPFVKDGRYLCAQQIDGTT